MILLDSSACIDLLNGEPKIKAYLDQTSDLVYICTITIYEIQIGLEYLKRKNRSKYEKLNKIWLSFLNSIHILNLDSRAAMEAAKIYDDLVIAGQMIDDNDILIAGIMKSNGVSTIITQNKDHFMRIKGLSVVSY